MSTPASRILRRRFWASPFARHLSIAAEWALATTAAVALMALGSLGLR